MTDSTNPNGCKVVTLDLPGVSQERVTLQIESENSFYGGRTLYVLIDNVRQYHGTLAERYNLQSASVENGQLKLYLMTNEPDTILLPYNAGGG
jgi:HSP20 family molecular chaperone IbpA